MSGDKGQPTEGREVTVEEVREATKANVHELAPLIQAPEPVTVEVWDAWRREWYRGQVLAWRGSRVSVRYQSGLGMTHLVWVPAAAVRRL